MTDSTWRDTLPDEIKINPALQDFKDVDALASAFIETKAMVGDSIRLPGADAGTEAWEAFNTKLLDKVPGLVKIPTDGNESEMNALWSKLGRPASAEGYAGVPDSDNYLELASQLGLTKGQFNILVEKENAKAMASNSAAQVAQDSSRAEVMGEWGAAKEQKLRQIRIMLEATDAPAALKEAAANLDIDGKFLRWAETLVTSIGGNEASNISGDGTGQQSMGVMTPADANAKIMESRGNNEHAFYNRNDPGHQQAMKNMLVLHDLAAGRAPPKS
jgi:hypothetical protein